MALVTDASGRLAHLRRSTFAPHVGSGFSVGRVGSQPLAVKLTEVSDVTGAAGQEDAFSLLFTAGRRSAPLEAGIYRFEHPRIGRFSLFMSPVGRGVYARDYQAIINRIPG